MKHWHLTLLALALSVAGLPHAAAQEERPMVHEVMPGAASAMDHGDMSGAQAMDHGDMSGAQAMDHGDMSGTAQAMDHGDMSGPAHPRDQGGTSASMAGMNMNRDTAAMQGGSPPPDARDPHAYSDGEDFGPIPRPRLADEHNFGSLLFDRFESVQSSDNSAAAYEIQGWFGRDYDRAVLKAEGEVDKGELEEGRTELLWGHAVAAYWDTQLGLRYDSGNVGPNRTWLAFGLQGLAPYWFEIDATGYVGEEGRTALRMEAEYELLLTQRLILQPRVEANLYGKADEERGLGKGLSEVAAGLRLRYEIKRQFAPYLGIDWLGLYGDTADFARAANEVTDETRWVAGLRMWF